MKRLLFIMMILMLVFSVFTVNSMLVFAEGEDEDPAGSEETIPEGDGDSTTVPEGGEGSGELPPEDTKEGGEELPPEGENDGEQDSTDNNENQESEPTDEEEIKGLFAELGTVLGEVKDEFVGMFKDLLAFIGNNETYSTIAGVLLAVIAILFIPLIIALLVIGYIAIAMIVVVSSALMSLIELVVSTFVGALFLV